MDATQHEEFRPFEVLVSTGGDAVRVAPVGEVDMATAEGLQERVDALLAKGCSRLVLDLHGVTFMDSTGVRVVLDLVRRAEQGPWKLSVAAMPYAVRRVFELSGVLESVPLGEPEAV
jgi:anti-sigma B factor antagonist